METTTQQVTRLCELAGSLSGRRALIVGNGESRLAFDLADVADDVLLFGCNALYRDHSPDYLGAVDIHMTAEIIKEYSLERGYQFIGPAGRAEEWGRAGKGVSHVIVCTLGPEWTTGPMMVRAAAILGCSSIFLTGFDLGWTPRPGRINSVYRDTPLYGTGDLGPCYHVQSWPEQLESVFAEFGDHRFLQIGPSTLSVPQAEWSELR